MRSIEPKTVSDPGRPGDPERVQPVQHEAGSGVPGSVAMIRKKPLVVRITRVIVGGALVALCVVLVSWWATGGRWFIVRTPSMGTYAPVGTLLWVKPVNIDHLHVGDVITFHTPAISETVRAGTGASRVVTVASQTYTHRVVAVDRGTVQTKGDLNQGRDPWHTDQQHLVGQVEAAVPGVGWLVGALPLLIPGCIAWWVLTGVLASGRSRAPLRVLGAAALLAAAIFVYNPLFGAVQLAFIPLGRAGAKATYVSTGMMPVQLVAEGARSVFVHAGQARSIVSSQLGQGGRYHVKVVPTIPWQTWILVAAVGLAPAMWSVVTGVEPQPARGRPRHLRRFRHRELGEAPQ